MPHKITDCSSMINEDQQENVLDEKAMQNIQERCQRIRDSSNPLYDAAKIAVYINCLIEFLREQGFKYKHENSFDRNKPDSFEVIEVKSDKKVKCEISNDLFKLYFGDVQFDDDSSGSSRSESTSNEGEEITITEEEIEMINGVAFSAIKEDK
ncbi:7007_t:CDS:1 [Funneliformis geosporum]|uniref:9215_t:CDS:1 n=1 Tax=Funneliformis geosporum TaxID=1117311 RepID=A0A9W4SSR6_9GLOM|nr:7007_t:CDS:1 [Funneliformis geosporum]CAI2180215.1 9215_t:CDS:1 [Funneliformis geosporum]